MTDIERTVAIVRALLPEYPGSCALVTSLAVHERARRATDAISEKMPYLARAGCAGCLRESHDSSRVPTEAIQVAKESELPGAVAKSFERLTQLITDALAPLPKDTEVRWTGASLRLDVTESGYDVGADTLLLIKKAGVS